MLCVRTLRIKFYDHETGELLKEYPYQVTGDDDSAQYVLLNAKRLVSFLSSFIRGCSKKEHLSITFSFDKEIIF